MASMQPATFGGVASLQTLAALRVEQSKGPLPQRILPILRIVSSIPQDQRNLVLSRQLPLPQRVGILLRNMGQDVGEVVERLPFFKEVFGQMMQGASQEELAVVRGFLLRGECEVFSADLYLSYLLHENIPFSSQEKTLWEKRFCRAVKREDVYVVDAMLEAGVSMPYSKELLEKACGEVPLLWLTALWSCNIPLQDLVEIFKKKVDAFGDALCFEVLNSIFCSGFFVHNDLLSIQELFVSGCYVGRQKEIERGLFQEVLSWSAQGANSRLFALLCTKVPVYGGLDSNIKPGNEFLFQGVQALCGDFYRWFLICFQQRGGNFYELSPLGECSLGDPCLAAILRRLSRDEPFWGELLKNYVEMRVYGKDVQSAYTKLSVRPVSEILAFVQEIGEKCAMPMLKNPAFAQFVPEIHGLDCITDGVLGEIPYESIAHILTNKRDLDFVRLWMGENKSYLLYLPDNLRDAILETEPLREQFLQFALEGMSVQDIFRMLAIMEKIPSNDPAFLRMMDDFRGRGDDPDLRRELYSFVTRRWDSIPLISGSQRRAFLWEALWNGEWALAWRLFRSFFV